MPRGRHPKPVHLRRSRSKKTSAAVIEAQPPGSRVPALPNPDKRQWHPLTVASWTHAWESPMASQWMQTDEDALSRLACLWDDFYRKPAASLLAEIRLQESRFGLSPLDRSRLSWEYKRSGEAQRPARPEPPAARPDPRLILLPSAGQHREPAS
jgi:hypothetical protein